MSLKNTRYQSSTHVRCPQITHNAEWSLRPGRRVRGHVQLLLGHFAVMLSHLSSWKSMETETLQAHRGQGFIRLNISFRKNISGF